MKTSIKIYLSQEQKTALKIEAIKKNTNLSKLVLERLANKQTTNITDEQKVVLNDVLNRFGGSMTQTQREVIKTLKNGKESL